MALYDSCFVYMRNYYKTFPNFWVFHGSRKTEDQKNDVMLHII